MRASVIILTFSSISTALLAWSLGECHRMAVLGGAVFQLQDYDFSRCEPLAGRRVSRAVLLLA